MEQKKPLRNLSGFIPQGPLDGQDFSGSDFSGASLKSVSAQKTNFSGSTFFRTDVTGADFSGAKFGYCRMQGVIGLPQANLNNTDFSGANFTGVDVTGMNMSSICFDKADLRGIVGLKDAKLDGLYVSDARMAGLDLSNTVVTNPYAHSAEMQGVNLSGAKWSQKSEDRLTGFSAAKLCGTNFADASMAGLSFRQADLSGTDLRGTNFSGCDFSGATLIGAKIDGKTDFTGAAIGSASFLENPKDNIFFLYKLVMEKGAVTNLRDAKERNFDPLCLQGINPINEYEHEGSQNCGSIWSRRQDRLLDKGPFGIGIWATGEDGIQAKAQENLLKDYTFFHVIDWLLTLDHLKKEHKKSDGRDWVSAERVQNEIIAMCPPAMCDLFESLRSDKAGNPPAKAKLYADGKLDLQDVWARAETQLNATDPSRPEKVAKYNLWLDNLD